MNYESLQIFRKLIYYKKKKHFRNYKSIYFLDENRKYSITDNKEKM